MPDWGIHLPNEASKRTRKRLMDLRARGTPEMPADDLPHAEAGANPRRCFRSGADRNERAIPGKNPGRKTANENEPSKCLDSGAGPLHDGRERKRRGHQLHHQRCANRVHHRRLRADGQHSSGAGGASATIVFVPDTTSNTRFPSHINPGNSCMHGLDDTSGRRGVCDFQSIPVEKASPRFAPRTRRSIDG
jgi:hypothetical protein